MERALSWLTNLKDRRQCVKINSNQSLKITCGVPQGSVLGPHFFILSINDIYKISELLNFVLFADDTNSYWKIFRLASEHSIEGNKTF